MKRHTIEACGAEPDFARQSFADAGIVAMEIHRSNDLPGFFKDVSFFTGAEKAFRIASTCSGVPRARAFAIIAAG